MNHENTLPASTNEETKAVTMSDTLGDLGISSEDLVIPRLMLMQNTSEYVGDDKAELGDIVDSQSIDVIGGINKPVEIVPLKMYKTWRVYDMSSKQPKFKRQEPVTAANAELKWEFIEDGVPHRRVFHMNFFVLRKDELDQGMSFPAVISFKSTSLNAGKQLATAMFKLHHLGLPAFSQSQMLTVKKEKKDTNTYAVFEIRKGQTLTAEQQAAAKRWIQTLAEKRHTVDEDEAPAPKAAAPSVVNEEVEELSF